MTSPASMPVFSAGLSRHHAGDQRARGFFQPQTFGDFLADGLDVNAEKSALHHAVVTQLRDDMARLGRGDGKTDADTAAVGRVYDAVHADYFPLGVEQRAAGIAAIDGRVDLDEVVQRARLNIAPVGRDDAAGGGSAEAERVCQSQSPSRPPVPNPSRRI